MVSRFPLRVFVAGATGAVGKSLVPALARRGHRVAAMARHPGVIPACPNVTLIASNALEESAVRSAMREFRPNVVVHQLTSLAGNSDLARFQDTFANTNILRTKGTDILLESAIDCGAQRFIAQSFCGWPYEQVGGNVKTERDPLDPSPPAQLRKTLDSIRYMESAVVSSTKLKGVALRYGSFYGPNTHLSPGSDFAEVIRKRRFPVIGGGTGVWSFVHIEDVANATCEAVERDVSGVFNVVDDDPAAVSEWLPTLARILNAPKPFQIPSWLARVFAPNHLIAMMTMSRGGSNALFRKTYGWEPKFPSWRQGFAEVFSSIVQEELSR